MKIQLDYDKKIVSIENNVNLADFVDKIQKILPDWQKWKLETKTEIIWQNPITVKENVYPWWREKRQPYFPEPVWVTTEGNSPTTYNLNDRDITGVTGKYQLDVQ